MFTVQQGTEQYRIVAPNGDASDLVDYGELAELNTGGKDYIALVDFDEENPEEIVSLLPDWVMCATVEPAEVEDVEFDDPDGEDVSVEQVVGGGE